jgi:hypothetical protein
MDDERRGAPKAATALGSGGRPFARWRALFSMVAALVLAGNTLLMLSDRAPGLLSRLSARLEGSERAPARLVTGTPVPESPATVHIAAWALAMVAVGMAMWSWRSLLISGLTLFAFSALLEPAQELLTDTREMQAGDVASNALGIASGAVVVLAVWTGLQWSRRNRPGAAAATPDS